MTGSPQAVSHQGRQGAVDEKFQKLSLLTNPELSLPDRLGGIAEGFAEVLAFQVRVDLLFISLGHSFAYHTCFGSAQMG